MKVKARIRMRTSKLRHHRHMTQKQLAQRACLSKTTISNLESGRQTKIELETIAKLCHALDCTPEELFEFVQETQSNISQKSALSKYIGTMEYDVPFDPEKLDTDLANILNIKKGDKKIDHC